MNNFVPRSIGEVEVLTQRVACGQTNRIAFGHNAPAKTEIAARKKQRPRHRELWRGRVASRLANRGDVPRGRSATTPPDAGGSEAIGRQ
jgi:hypothetical protein